MVDTDTACARQQVMLRAKYSNDIKSEKEKVEWEGRQTEERRRGLFFTLFTRRTHHPQLERRCLDKDNPRADPECMW